MAHDVERALMGGTADRSMLADAMGTGEYGHRMPVGEGVQAVANVEADERARQQAERFLAETLARESELPQRASEAIGATPPKTRKAEEPLRYLTHGS